MDVEKKRKTKLALEIVSFIGVFLLFFCSLVCVIATFNGAKFDLFGNRYDVVLTESMASKNPEHADFLEPYNNQAQAFDLVVSKKLPNPEELKTGDIVIYTDRLIGTNMHRIVDVKEKYSENIYFTNASLKTVGDKAGIILNDLGSSIDTSDIRFETMSITTYAKSENTNNLMFYVLDEKFTPTVNKVDAGDGTGNYFITYSIKRTSKSPGKVKIYHKDNYDFANELIVNVHVDSLNGVFDVDMNNLVPSNGITQVYSQSFNVQYAYEIRGDASVNSDGWYSYNELQALVVNNVPKAGFIIRFMGSGWGGVMFALLAVLILVTDIIMGRLDKKELEKANAEISSESIDGDKPVEEEHVEKVEEQPAVQEEPKAEEKVEEQPKVEEEPKPEEPKTKGRFVPKGGKQKKINWPPKNTRWTKENNPTANKKRAEGEDK